MDFGANKTPVEVIREGAFGGTYFRDIYAGVTGKWYKRSKWIRSVRRFWSEVLLFRSIVMSVLTNMELNAEHR